MVTQPPQAALSPGMSVPKYPKRSNTESGNRRWSAAGPGRAATTSVLARLKRPAISAHPQADKEHNMAEQHRITLVDTLRQKPKLRRLEEVFLNEKGELLIKASRIGSALREAYGDSDLEDDIRIGTEDVPQVLMGLIAESFRNAAEFKVWLMKNQIEYTRSIW